MTRIAIISGTLAVALVSQALALTPPPLPCEGNWDRRGHVIHWTTNDMQPGATLTYSVDQAGDFASSYTFEDCKTGSHLRVVLTPAQTDDWDNNGKHVQDAFYAAVRSSETFTFKKLRRAFRRAGYEANTFNATTESCGCNVYAPQLRGTKIPYEARR